MGDYVYRIDRHPVMRSHPVTPMDEPDLRLHFERQGWQRISLVAFTDYVNGSAHLAEIIDSRLAESERTILFDVSREDDLAVIGAVLRRLSKRQKILCVGASSVVEALYADRTMPELVSSRRVVNQEFPGPVFAFCGSRASVTAEQIRHAVSYEAVAVDGAMLRDVSRRRALVQRCRASLAEGSNTLVHLDAADGTRSDGAAMAATTAGFIKDVVDGPSIGCLALAGGDTASAAVERLGIHSISMVSDFDQGVPVVQAQARGRLDGLPMILKGGQMGSPGLFEALVEMTRPVNVVAPKC